MDALSATSEERIRRKASELGFSACGFADCADFSSEVSYFEQWLQEGNQSEMEYLSRNRELRYHPSLLSEGCHSVVVLLLNYHRKDYASLKSSSYCVSEYALGRDYHLVMRERLHLLSAYMQTLGKDVRCRCCVDTAPVLEKAMAARAGLGWIGKNTLLQTDSGSRFFIGEVFTSLPLQAGHPIENACGSCRACVDACPTHALSEPYRLDARRCLSCQTIERRSLPLPPFLRKAMSKTIYGCDVCQRVCPYNAHSKETEISDFLRVPNWFSWTDSDWEQMDASDFKAAFGDSAMQRAGWELLRENIQAASENH